MALKTGTRLGPYEITAPLGAGGMGEVYRAVDRRLDREVAVKILPDHLAGSPERRARFEREALAISKLNHPKICTLHDVGEEAGVHYLVLELLEGETLADRIERGPLPVTEALHLGAEIAEALDAAHRRGLVHRDLKPGNVMLTRAGIKLLDFGLARALETPASDRSKAATVTTPVTAVNTVVGTLQYMAPEQIEGKPADARSDLFALGAVLYEMITGRRAFQGETQGSLSASILKEEPPPLAESIPSSPGVGRCVLRCLAKDPEQRWQSARDLMHELLWLAEEKEGARAPAPESGPRSAWRLYAAVAAVALAAGLIAGWMTRGTSRPGDVRPIRLELSLPEGTRLNGWASPVAAIAPDGGAVAFVADGEDGVARLYVRALGSPEAKLVPDSESAEGPFFSPDGRWVGFAVGVSASSGREGELLKYSLETGLTQPICSIEDYFGAAWGADGEILFANTFRGGLWQVPAAGGSPRNILPAFRVDGKEVRSPLAWPRLLPDGRHALLIDTDPRRSRLAVVDLESGELAHLGIQGARAFLAGDHLFYTDAEGALFGVRFDERRRVPAGAPVAVMDGIALTRFDVPVLDISANGTLVYAKGFVRGSRIMPSELVRIDGAGAASVLPFPPQMIHQSIAVSPSGDRLAAALRDGSIWIYDIDRGTRSMLPAGEPSSISYLSWSPDGRQIAFTSETSEHIALMRQPANGRSGPEVVLSEETAELYAGGWTPDGTAILYGRYANESESIRLAPLQKGAEPKTLVDGLKLSLSAGLSPDGRWLAYDSPDSGDYEVYVQAMSGASGRLVVSTDGGRNPRWSTDGRTLFYYNAGRIMGVSVPPSPGGKFGRPRTVTETDIDQRFCVDPRGGFYGFRPVPGVGIHGSLNVILNWKALPKPSPR